MKLKTLALTLAAGAHSEHVSGLILRGISAATAAEMEYFRRLKASTAGPGLRSGRPAA